MNTPYYIVYEEKLRKNLDLITRVMNEAGVKIIMAFKANALWKTFPIFREYGIETTASSVNEMLLANDEMKCKAHAYCPVYTDTTIKQFIEGCSHITFNSIAQYLKHKQTIENSGKDISCGLRINPMCSVIETDIYNPCCPGSRFGITKEEINELPEGIEGFHFHALCESTSYDLSKVLVAVEEQFGEYLPKLKWLNMGGGHLMTRADYDVEHLIKLLQNFKTKHPNLDIILEPGSAFCWQTGDLEATVVDVVENNGIKTAIVDVSFACHMPDCLEMPYHPAVRGAKTLETEEEVEASTSPYVYRLGGNSCLSGDFMSSWQFEKELHIGDYIVFEDMIHYTTVKTNMFNGVSHPAIALYREDGTIEMLRSFTYEDYKSRMD